MEDYEQVRQDFNQIAALPDPPAWNHNNCYFPYLLRVLPAQPGLCLDIGCGQGELSALLADRAERVLAVDLAENMLAYAEAHNHRPNIDYRCGNILEMDFPDGCFDAIVTTATAHHLPFEWLLRFAARTLRPGGTLAVLDLARAETLSDKLLWGFAAIPNVFMNLWKNGRLHKDDPHSAAVWREHGRRDVYLTFREVQRLAAKCLPGAYSRRLLFWRYVLVWRKMGE